MVPLLETNAQGFFTYKHADGSNSMILVSNGCVYSVDPANKEKTQIGTINGNGKCHAVNSAGKLWIVNGTDFVKVEDNLKCYRVQILAPSEATLTAISGGTLAEGSYDVYLAYTRRDAAGRSLHSIPLFAGTISLDGSQAISVSTIASDDPQVTNVTAFITDANGTVPYYYGEAENESPLIDIYNTDSRNKNITMASVSANNQLLPISPDAIYAFDDRLFVWDINTNNIYWSLKTDINPFDQERYLSQNFRTLAYSVNALFSIGVNLYFNHTGIGISIAYNGDMSSIIKIVNRDFWYLDCFVPDGKSNVCMFKGMALGLTNDGFRFFDGENFSEDISFHIKPDVDKIYQGIGSVTPCAIINRRAGKRTEYRFSYANRDYGSEYDNDQRIFNLDFYFESGRSRKTWECWENGFDRQVIYQDTWYGMQNGNSGCQVVVEVSTADLNCYDRTGTVTNSLFLKQAYMKSRLVINGLESITIWGPPYSLSNAKDAIAGNVIILDQNNAKYGFTIQGNPEKGMAISEDSGPEFPFVLNPQFPLAGSDPISAACKGNSIQIELSQTSDDPDFFLYKMQFPRAKQIVNNLT